MMIKIENLEKYSTENRGFQGIPGIEITPKGRLWATWYTGGDNEGPENFVVLVTSSDGGENWSEPVSVIDPPGNYRAYDPTLWIGPDNVLRWFWAETESKDGCISNGVDGVWFIACSNIEDDKPEWSEPVRIANGVMMNKPVVLSDGDWVFPTALWCKEVGGKRAPEELQHECFSNATVSSDGGRTFSLRGGADIPDRGFDEHHIIELNDGRLWCLTRTGYGVGDSFSSDKGITWSKGRTDAMEGPCSRIFIRRLTSGNLLLVNHVVDKKEKNVRKDLTAWISKDDGKSWIGGLLLDERRDVSYPDGCQDSNGNIWITYDHDRYKCGDILFAKFTEEDVIAGKIVSETSKLKQMINRTGGVKASYDLPPFKAGERILFIGDSIISQYGFVNHIQTYYATRFPDVEFETVNVGVPGDTVDSALRLRYDWDIAPRDGDVAFLMFGMNDVKRHLYAKDKVGENEKERREAIVTFAENLAVLAEKLSKKGMRLIFSMPSIYDQTSTMEEENLFGVNDAFIDMKRVIRPIAEKYNGKMSDFNGWMLHYNKLIQKVDPTKSIVGPDRVHPQALGHMLMGHVFLRAQGMKPLVSNITLNKGEIVESLNAMVSNIEYGSSLSFDVLSKALPFPCDDAATLAEFEKRCYEELNSELLTVKGLDEGHYKLSIDGEIIGQYTEAELADGINLAKCHNTPQYKQAKKVGELISKRGEIFTKKIRPTIMVKSFHLTDIEDKSQENINRIVEEQLKGCRERNWEYGIFIFETYKANIDKLDELTSQADELLAKAYECNKPMLHNYKLVYKK